MAAKKQRGSVKDPFSSEGKPYFFDVGIADEMAVCYSCHAGGGVAEGIVNEDGSVTPYNTSGLKPVHTYDRDFYSYPPTANTYALLSGKSIEETIKDIGAPKKHDWSKSGVMENDCLLCHQDPESPNTLVAADGLKAQIFRPRLMIFAEKDSNGKIVKISLGTPLQPGKYAQTFEQYSDDAQRMGRPTSKLLLFMLPKEDVGNLMQIWMDGLKAIAEAKGVNALPYALYAPPTIVPDIYTQTGLKDEYTYNPNGGADEIQKLMALQNEIGGIFQNIIQYAAQKYNVEISMEDLNRAFFNDFIYGYEIRDPMSGQLLPIPYPLRKYDVGKFYTDWDNPQASVRDFMRAPFYEGEGIPYTGMIGIGWGAMMYGVQQAMQGDMTYMKPDGSIDVAKVLADFENGKIPADKIKPALHNAIGYKFYMMPTARLMGTDPNHDGAPLTYVQLVRNGNEWEAKAYYNAEDLGDGNIHFDIFGGHKDMNSWKWVKICGQCHVLYRDDGNSGWDVMRPFGLGMGADYVKNGRFVNFTNDTEASGYEVHESSKKMGCGTCHFRESFNSLEDAHNFLKGTDTAHMVHNDLDNNPKPKTCEYCHLEGGDPDAPNPNQAHEEKFGELTEKHIANISCQACHIPYRRTWRFRAFNDTLGYYLNFDNGFGYNVLPGGDGSAMAFPGPYRISPIYGTSPGYGLSQLNMLANHIDADGNGVVPMDFVSQMAGYFEMWTEADPGKIVNGMPTNPKFDFMHLFYKLSLDQYKQMGLPINYDPKHDLESIPPLYWANGTNGYPQIVIGNPITIMTWVDLNPEPDHDMSDLPYNGAKVLYIREMNAAVKAFMPRVGMNPTITPQQLAQIPPNSKEWAQNPYVGKIILKDSNYVIFDHTGDGFPDLWWPEDVQAMREALIKVLKAEGEKDPDPRVFIAAHFFSDSHGVQTKEHALGAKTCYDCHGDYKKNPGQHRITDREIVFIPWAAPFMEDKYRFSKDNPNGLYVMDKEVSYIHVQEANGLRFMGAKAEDVLKATKEHAEELFYIAAEGTVPQGEIATELGVDSSKFTEDELNTVYVRQIVNGPWSDKHYFYVPKELKPKIVEMGFQVGKAEVYADNFGFAEGYILKMKIEDLNNKSVIVKLPFNGSEPVILHKGEEDKTFKKIEDVEILTYNGRYITVKVRENGEYMAAEKTNCGVLGTLYSPWK